MKLSSNKLALFTLCLFSVTLFSLACTKTQQVTQPIKKQSVESTSTINILENTLARLHKTQSIEDASTKKNELNQIHQVLEQYSHDKNLPYVIGSSCIKRAIINMEQDSMNFSNNNIKRALLEIYQEIETYYSSNK